MTLAIRTLDFIRDFKVVESVGNVIDLSKLWLMMLSYSIRTLLPQLIFKDQKLVVILLDLTDTIPFLILDNNLEPVLPIDLMYILSNLYSKQLTQLNRITVTMLLVAFAAFNLPLLQIILFITPNRVAYIHKRIHMPYTVHTIILDPVDTHHTQSNSQRAFETQYDLPYLHRVYICIELKVKLLLYRRQEASYPVQSYCNKVRIKPFSRLQYHYHKLPQYNYYVLEVSWDQQKVLYCKVEVHPEVDIVLQHTGHRLAYA